MNLEASKTEPPPTASSTSIFSFLQISAPLFTEVCLGFGSIPEHSNTSKPASLSSFIILSYNPIFLMDPPPYINKTRLPNLASSSPRYPNLFSPK